MVILRQHVKQPTWVAKPGSGVLSFLDKVAACGLKRPFRNGSSRFCLGKRCLCKRKGRDQRGAEIGRCDTLGAILASFELCCGCELRCRCWLRSQTSEGFLGIFRRPVWPTAWERGSRGPFCSPTVRPWRGQTQSASLFSTPQLPQRSVRRERLDR